MKKYQNTKFCVVIVVCFEAYWSVFLTVWLVAFSSKIREREKFVSHFLTKQQILNNIFQKTTPHWDRLLQLLMKHSTFNTSHSLKRRKWHGPKERKVRHSRIKTMLTVFFRFTTKNSFPKAWLWILNIILKGLLAKIYCVRPGYKLIFIALPIAYLDANFCQKRKNVIKLCYPSYLPDLAPNAFFGCFWKYLQYDFYFNRRF